LTERLQFERGAAQLAPEGVGESETVLQFFAAERHGAGEIQLRA
jgi:hypothetical protein